MAEGSSNARLLLVEDDLELARTVGETLCTAQITTERAPSLADALRCLLTRSYDLIVLDLGLPDGNGLMLADFVRSRSETPILMLTAQAALEQRLAGFAHGADDYVCKPFAAEELVARVKALLWRARPERQHMLRYGALELDLLTRVVRRGGIESILSERETALLAHLIRHAEEPLSRETLAQEVWGLPPDGDIGIVNVYVNYLRNKLERGDRHVRLIHTVRGVGYMLSESAPE